MEGIKIVAFVFFLWGFLLCTVEGQFCTLEQNASGKIFSDGNFTDLQICWNIPVTPGHFIRLKHITLISNYSCEDIYARINVEGRFNDYKICGTDSDENSINALGNVTITYYVKYLRASTSFELEYVIESIECMNDNSFRCDNSSCVPDEQVCDGVEDCKNGADEIGCESRIPFIEGTYKMRDKAISWLKQKRTAAWGWKEYTPRAIVALYLSLGATFNGTDLQEELMAKQNEVKAAVALMRISLTVSELSMFINALLVTCHNPRHFYGNDLVRRLKEQVAESGNFTHPLAYLALCNANETWPSKATSDLNSILNSNSEYPFAKDLQTMAVMALSCERRRRRSDGNVLKNTTLTLFKNTIKHFKELQAHDGSFGNVYTTALITQALLSSGHEHRKDWNPNATIQYLMKEMNSSSVDLLSTCLTLPILYGESLVDISHVNCSANPRKQGDDPISEINDNLGPKIRVQYSLFIGDEKDVVQTISLRVPMNYTASQVMEFAEIENSKYKFEWKLTSGKMYVYKMANITNDPEAGKFWLLYVGSSNSSVPLIHLTKGPDEVVMHDGEHLVFWYKTASI